MNTSILPHYDRRVSDKAAAANDILYARHAINVYVTVKLYVIFSLLITLYDIIINRSILSHALFNLIDRQYSMIAVSGALIIAMIALVDALLINKMLVNKLRLHIITENRHIIYMFLSLCMYGIAAAVISSDVHPIVVYRIMLDGLIAAAIAVFDIYTKLTVLRLNEYENVAKNSSS